MTDTGQQPCILALDVAVFARVNKASITIEAARIFQGVRLVPSPPTGGKSQREGGMPTNIGLLGTITDTLQECFSGVIEQSPQLTPMPWIGSGRYPGH